MAGFGFASWIFPFSFRKLIQSIKVSVVSLISSVLFLSYTLLLAVYLTDGSSEQTASRILPRLARRVNRSVCRCQLDSLTELADWLTDWLVSWLAEWCHSRFMLPGHCDNSGQTHRAPHGGAVKPLIVSTCFLETTEFLLLSVCPWLILLSKILFWI